MLFFLNSKDKAQDVVSIEPERFWSSWWGSETESTTNFFSKLLDDLAKNEKVDIEAMKKLGKSLSKMNDKHFYGDKNYKMGSKWKYGNINIVDKKKTVYKGSIIGVGAKAEGEHGSASVDLLYANVSGRAQVGPDHIKLSGSAEASLLHAEAKAYGTKEINGYNIASVSGQATTDVGHVYAKGDFGVGYYKGEDGKMHLDAGVKAEIGADLCSASAKGSYSILGVGGAGEVKAKIGIGAQLNAGFQDGKFNFKIGVAVGIGIELGVSLDFGGAIDNAKQLASDIYNSDFGQACVETCEKFASWLFG